MNGCPDIRQRLIKALQRSLKEIRITLNLGVQELSDIVQLTRQSYNNLESKKVLMTGIQFLAFGAVIDQGLRRMPEKLPIVMRILNQNDEHHDLIDEDAAAPFLLKLWFDSFPNDSKMILLYQDITEELAANYKVFLDGTALCGLGESVWTRLTAQMAAASRKIYVPVVAVDHLQSQLFSENTQEANHAKTALSRLIALQKAGMAEFRGDKSDTDVQSTLLSAFTRYKPHHRLALITQDEPLALALLYLNEAVSGFPVQVLYAEGEQLKSWEEATASRHMTDEIMR